MHPTLGETFLLGPGKSTTRKNRSTTMAIAAERKKELIETYAIETGDTGSA